ncbi:LysM peptidoglycan-binding domain-containing protein [Gynuella sp.]|uniref:LysM peptidoglycan-binding domain-containing protein n=1 Tax=Gynuella sp. TaxID=2969146 RepID=UPI003D0F2CB3
MTQSRFDALKTALKQADQTYTIQSGDNLYDLAKGLDYVNYLVIWRANTDKIKSSTDSSSPVLHVGDELTLPKYTVANYRPEVDQAMKTAWQIEQEQANHLARARTGVVHGTGQQNWQSVRIYWGNEDLEDLNTTFPFARIHELPDNILSSKERPAVAVLDQDVRINRFENLAGNVILQQQEDKTVEWDQALRTHEDMAEAHAQATRMQVESVYVPDTQLDKNYDFDDRSGRYGKPKKLRKLDKCRRGRIASAVSQHVIVRIEMSGPVTKPAELPSLDTWAFLQPPSIGGNPYRLNGNNQWVTDDAQKAGWFHGWILGVEAEEIGKNLYKVPLTQFRPLFTEQEGTDSHQSFQQVLEARMKVDDNNPRVVYVKYPAIVYNDCTKEDFKRRRQQLLEKEKYQDVLSIEVGSYMKIWVRNHTYKWMDDGPKDEYNEDLPNSMAVDDPYLFPQTLSDGRSNPGFNPQLCRNHTWRRERLVDGRIETDPDTGKVREQAVDSASKSYGDLLYVGLYPAELINALNRVSQPEQPGKPRELNVFNWLGTSVAYAVLLNTLKRILRHAAAKKAAKQYDPSLPDRQKPEYWEYEYGKTIKKFLGTVMIPELFAVQAVDSFSSKFDFDVALNRIKGIFKQVGDDDELGKKIDQIDTSKSGAEIRRQIRDLKLPQAMIERFDIIVAKKTGVALKKALDDEIKTAKNEVNIAGTFKTTLKIYGHILNFALLDSDNPFLTADEKKARHDKDAGALARVLDSGSTSLFARLWGRFQSANSKDLLKAMKELIGSLMNGEEQHALSFETSLDLLSFNDAKLFPTPAGSPLPPPLSFILYSLMVRLKGKLPLTLAGQYQASAKNALNLDFETLSDEARQEKLDQNNAVIEKGQQYGGLTIGLGSEKAPVSASVEVLFQLQAAWTAAVQRFDDQSNGIHYTGTASDQDWDEGLHDMLWGPLIKDIFDYIEVSFTVGPKLELSNHVQWQLAYLFEDEQNLQNPTFASQFINQLKDLGGQIKLSCPISAKLSVFAWQTDIMTAQLATLKKEEATFFDDVTLFGKDVVDSGVKVTWGVGQYTEYLFRHYRTPEEVYIGDQISVILGALKRPLDTTFKGEFLWAENQNDSTKLLVSLNDRNFHIQRSIDYIDSAEESLRKDVAEQVKDFEEIISIALQISFNQKADLEIGAHAQHKKIKILSLSKDRDNAYSISGDQKLWELFKKKKEIYLKANILPKNRTAIELFNNQPIKLKLPVVENIRGHVTRKGQDCLKFSVWFRNFKRQYEHVWIQLVETGDSVFDHPLDVKIRAWDETEEAFKNKPYSKWNLVRMKQDVADKNKYTVEIPLAGLNPKQIQEEFDSWLEDFELDIGIKFGYFEAVDGDEYLLAEELDDQTTAKLDIEAYKPYMNK